MTGYLLIYWAAFFNACMDAFENENFFESMFRNSNQRIWYKRESWKYAKKIFGYKLDAWHISKSCMILCFCGALAFPPKDSWWVIVINYGLIWNLTFWLFYHKVFGIK